MFKKIDARRVYRIWALGVFCLILACALLCVTLLVLDLSQPDEPSVLQEQQQQPSADPPQDPPSDPADTDAYIAGSRVLAQTPDAGQGYIDRMIFLGESTTSHLRSRGVLSGGTKTQQVWSNKENTMMLDLNILQKTVYWSSSDENVTIAEAIERAKPEILVLCFGVNGLNTFDKNEELYRVAYGRLIDAVHEASPNTVVLLQTVYPVASNQDTFSQGARAVNAVIDRLNQSLVTIAEQHNAYVVDTASVLKDERGMLKNEYQNGDGLHLETVAYEQILMYLRTHAYDLSR